jgi:hypothetical protein
VVAVSTPFDAELTRLNRELADTALGWGDRASQASVSRKKKARQAMKAEVAASAASLAAKRPGAGLGRGDLLADLDRGAVELEAVESDELPAEMQKMSEGEQKAYIGRARAKRQAVQKQLAEVSRKRDAWLKNNASAAAKPSLDSEVMSAVKKQARRKINVSY